jgi:hypothetical protein
MASPLVETKLFVPAARRDVVARPRLRERLDQGAAARLTLLSAPAGFGKTTQGRLSEAAGAYEDALRLAAGAPTTVRGTADMYVGLSQIACERNDLEAAARLLARSRQLGEYSGLPQNPYRWRVATARLRQLQGDVDCCHR